MGKFDGILMVSDLDATLLYHGEKPLRISEENKAAIRYFEAEGGLFTLGTGRIPCSIAPFVEGFSLNAPVITFNGAAIYDWDKEEYLWTLPVEDGAIRAVEYVEEHFPFAGIEIYCTDATYHSRRNEFTQQQFDEEKIPPIVKNYREVPFPWMKVLFAQTEKETEFLRREMEKTEFFREFTLTQSGPPYYEILNKRADKGVALCRLAEILHIPMRRTIGVGDGLNDKEMLKAAGLGIAPKNAVPEALSAADHIGVHCKDHLILDIVQKLESGEITIPA